ncbi:radical SAM/SPASM domain-containing protein [Bacteroidota bacterium]
MNIRAKIKKLYDSLPHQVRTFFRMIFPGIFTEPLFKQLPLSVPHSLHIDPVNLCNFKCAFCPTGDPSLLKKFNRPKGTMKFELFTKIIDDLKSVVDDSGQKVIELHLYKDGEPLLHKRLGEMISYVKSKDVAESIQTTSNGALLTQEKAIELIENGLDVIRISVEHVSGEGYKNVTQNFSDYDKIIGNVRFLFEEKNKRNSPLRIHSKILDVSLSLKEKEKFITDFQSISDEISINQLMGWSNSDEKDFTLGIDVNRGMGGKARLRKKKICPEPFRSLAINFDGQVSICCVDWSFGTIVGNISNESFSDIWNGDKLNEFRTLHINDERNKIKACSDCHYVLGFPDHLYLDSYVSRLKTLYNISE